MAKQLVVSGNRILAHGTNCFISMGGTVICSNTNRVYQNATVVNCDNIPSDIDEVGYEYHAGVFIPCAPFGKGKGNIAVFCSDDCKSLKDSGIPLKDVAVPKLLWENASPSSAFAEQNIFLNPQNYTFLLVETSEQVFVIKSSGGTISRTDIESSGVGGAWYVCVYDRTIETVTTAFGEPALQIGDCNYERVSSNNHTLYDSNEDLIPLRIYGM